MPTGVPTEEPAFLDRGDGVRLAFRHQPGPGPLVVFLPGYGSDMAGTKATFLAHRARAQGFAYLRLDYSGCGASQGRFDDGSITRWTADARAVVDHVHPSGSLLLVGSSMGAWIMLRLALALGPRVRGLVGIAAAPDFPEWGLALSAAEREALIRDGFFLRASRYGSEPQRFTRTFLEDAREARLLAGPIALAAPVRLLHGEADDDVPWEISVRLMRALASADVRLVLVKGGDHRLSGPAELELLARTVDELLARC